MYTDYCEQQTGNNEEKKPDENDDETTQTQENDGEIKQKKEQTQKYMVTYDKEGKVWVVKKTGATRASKKCKTKKEALEIAEKLANNQDLKLSVKKKDGKFQKLENAKK